MSEEDLESLLFQEAGAKSGARRRPEPDWASVHRELKRKHVTLQILWDEYIELHPDGYRYSRFCEIYRDLGREALGDDAPALCRRGEIVRRLCRRPRAGDHRPPYRRNARLH